MLVFLLFFQFWQKEHTHGKPKRGLAKINLKNYRKYAFGPLLTRQYNKYLKKICYKKLKKLTLN